MEISKWAERILGADTLEEKLFAPDFLTDDHPGPPRMFNEPVRPSHMGFQKHSKKDRLPGLDQLDDPDKRAACLHRFAGHELLAVEIMANALLSFPGAPKHFRRGLANTLKEEQEHVRLYMAQMKRLGISFGDLPLYRHFWTFAKELTTPTEYVSVMSLTLEMANLDFAPAFGKAFTQFGDHDAAALMKRILEDEIAHVSFGISWLKKLNPQENNLFEVWKGALPERLDEKQAVGKQFQEAPRKAAGVPDNWITALKESRR